MKTVLLVCIAVLTLTADVFAQRVMINAGIEQTVAGTEYAFRTGYHFRNAWGVGMYYQTHPRMIEEKVSPQSSFYGAYISVPLAVTERINLTTSLRGGLVNRNFVVVTPSLDTRVSVSRRTDIVISAGWRHAYPSFGILLSYQLNKTHYGKDE